MVLTIAFQAIFEGISAIRSMIDGIQRDSRDKFTILVDEQPGELTLYSSSCLGIALLGRARVFIMKDNCLLKAINESTSEEMDTIRRDMTQDVLLRCLLNSAAINGIKRARLTQPLCTSVLCVVIGK